ncbi:PREDICTED: uncharacterized protein LOC18589860 [Theobroma cacao]|uniref:Uncharacterized protein LOC18589860 n=1 Tax=Theobroma cacao TaxID=3641 RepID=A0AB32X3T6_THECC|nr:PREDICTED: uncharacterized protein LOC18589860 [Theobroma cacao]
MAAWMDHGMPTISGCFFCHLIEGKLQKQPHPIDGCSKVKEWRQKTLSSEAKANELQEQISVLNEEIERLRKERERKIVRARNRSPINQEAQNETEKRILVCHLKENRCANDDGCNQKELVRDGRRKTQTCTAGLLPRRSPLREIGNISALMKQHGEGILPLFCLHKEEMKRSF